MFYVYIGYHAIPIIQCLKTSLLVTRVAKCNCNVFIVQYASQSHQEPQEEGLSPCRTQLTSGQNCLHTLHDFPQKCKDQTPAPFPGRLCG